MTAFRFYVDAQGRICGGEAVCGTLSDEAWKLKACPVKSLEETGTEIAWPNGEMWTHDHIAQEWTDDNTERAA